MPFSIQRLVAIFPALALAVVPFAPAAVATSAQAGPVSIGTPGPDTISRASARFPVTILGLGGADSLTAGRAADLIRGGGGNDLIVGGPSHDTAAGGRGDDRFVYRPGDLRRKPGAERVLDFAGAGTSNPDHEQDRIVLDGFGRDARLAFVRDRRGPRTQVYQVRNGKGATVGRVVVTVDGRAIRHLGADDVLVLDPPPANHDPVLGPDDTGSVTQSTAAGGTLTDAGAIGFTDADAGQTHSVAVAPVGNSPVGALAAQLDGSEVHWTYSVGNDAVRHLAMGETAQERFRLTLYDNATPPGTDTADVTVVQHGVNDPPSASGALADQGATARSTTTWTVPAGAFTDPDDGDTLTLSAAGTGGVALPAWLTFTPGTRTFTATPLDGDLGSRVVVVTATDEHGATASEAFTLTVSAAPNEAPVLGSLGLTGGVTQVTATGQTLHDSDTIGFSDADTLQSHTISVTPVGGATGVLSAMVTSDAGGTGTVTWSYAVDNELVRHLGKDETETDSFVLTLSDGTATASTTVVITKTGINDVPVAGTDTVVWNVPNHGIGAPTSDTFTTNLLANDTDGDGDVLSAAGSGTWRIDGDPVVAGTFTVAADGTLTMDSGADPLGPVQQLREGEPWPATLTYVANDGTDTTPGTVKVTVVGGSDQVVKLGDFSSPDNQLIDHADPDPTLFDARGCYALPEGEFLQHSWSATSSGSVPPHPAFVVNQNTHTLSILNSEWGFDSQNSVTLTAVPSNGMPTTSRTIQFFVSDSGGAEPFTPPSCGEQSHRPYAPDVTATVDLSTGTGGVATGGNVLADVTEPDGQTVVAGGYGYIGGHVDPVATYLINPDGSITVTENPANPIGSGVSVEENIRYRAIDSDGNLAVGWVRITVIGDA